MSLSTVNFIKSDVKLKQIIWIIKQLGYKELTSNHGDRFFIWAPDDDSLAYVGVQLCISKENDKYHITTRTGAGRNIFELKKQNETVKILKEFFGGSFNTDEGRKYLDEGNAGDKKTPLSIALYKQISILNDSLLPIKIFNDFIDKHIDHGASAGNIYSDATGVLPEIDGWRPVIVSNNIQLPYIIGAWENYLKSSFLAIFKFGKTENKMLKVDRLTKEDLLKIKNGKSTVEDCIVSKLSFQRPSIIIENFKNLDPKLSISEAFLKPYNKKILRKK